MDVRIYQKLKKPDIKIAGLVHTRLLVHWLVSPSRNEFSFVHLLLHCRKKLSIQYYHRKWETHLRVFSRTLADGSSKNEIRQKMKIRDAWAWKEVKRARKNEVPKAEIIAQAYLPHGSKRPEYVDEFPN